MTWREKECDEGAVKVLVDSGDGLDALRARLLALRGVTPENLDEYLASPISALSRPDELPGAGDAAAAILRHVEAKGKIVVFGDYDCDGICAAAILHKAVEAVAPGISAVFLPDRLREGYGMGEKSVGRMLSENPGVTLVVTVDNGIGSAEEVRLLSEKGVECVVTDHHLPGETLPGCIVVDPKVASTPRTDSLCGAGVAFMLAGALVRLAREKGIYSGPNIGGPLLVLAGLATVGDIMPLSGDNRIIVRESLARFWRYAPPGVRELLSRALRTTPERLTSVDYAFRIVPRINADGRLASGMDAMKLVLTDDREEARRLAVAVDGRNVERKSIEQNMTEKALGLVEKGASAQVMEIPDGHKGVVGIVASRVMDSDVLEKRAPVAIAVGRHGSVRAPEGYNVRDALAAAAAVFYAVVLFLRYVARRVREHRMSPIERAWAELDRLVKRGLPGRGRYKDFYVELTMVVRRYVQRRYGVKAPHMTTEEFLSDPRFNSSGELKSFLESADMVKFAGVTATPEMADGATESARTYLKNDSASPEAERKEAVE